jgi:hypothetical protein
MFQEWAQRLVVLLGFALGWTVVAALFPVMAVWGAWDRLRGISVPPPPPPPQLDAREAAIAALCDRVSSNLGH